VHKRRSLRRLPYYVWKIRHVRARGHDGGTEREPSRPEKRPAVGGHEPADVRGWCWRDRGGDRDGRRGGRQESDELTLDYASDYVANPYVSATVNIAEHKADYSSALMYEDDDGNDTELPAVLDERDPDDEDETTENLYGVRPDAVGADSYVDFPRDTTREDADGDTVDISAVDADEWTTSSSAIVVEDGGLETQSIRIAGSGVSSGTTETATFQPSEFEAITDDVAKRVFAVGLNVDALPAGSLVEIKAVDSAGNSKTKTVDPSATPGRTR